MGLDISVYSNAVLVPFQHEYGEECWEAEHRRAFCYDGFERSLRGLEKDRCYTADYQFGFRAGSYSGYGEWRDLLCQYVYEDKKGRELWELAKTDPEKAQDVPFYELINFADNEGTIGSEAAKDLHLDFQGHLNIVRPKMEKLATWHAQSYDSWLKACMIAGNQNGMIVFH